MIKYGSEKGTHCKSQYLHKARGIQPLPFDPEYRFHLKHPRKSNTTALQVRFKKSYDFIPNVCINLPILYGTLYLDIFTFLFGNLADTLSQSYLQSVQSTQLGKTNTYHSACFSYIIS
jgi:hypothetical protein